MSGAGKPIALNLWQNGCPVFYTNFSKLPLNGVCLTVSQATDLPPKNLSNCTRGAPPQHPPQETPFSPRKCHLFAGGLQSVWTLRRNFPRPIGPIKGATAVAVTLWFFCRALPDEDEHCLEVCIPMG